MFISYTDPYYERYSDGPDEEPDIADWADFPDDPFEHPLLATAHSVSELLPGYHVAGSDTWQELPVSASPCPRVSVSHQQGELFEEVA